MAKRLHPGSTVLQRNAPFDARRESLGAAESLRLAMAAPLTTTGRLKSDVRKYPGR